MVYFKKINKKNICFIGLMGSGKTIIGKELSKILNIDFFDSDAEIEKNVGENINTIFKTKGEDYFRKKEEEICIDLLNLNNCVISLGGGSITNFNIRKLIKKNSYSVYLKVELKILLSRLHKSSRRPLLLNKDKKEVIEKLYNERKLYYNEANLIIENDFDKKNILQKLQLEIDF